MQKEGIEELFVQSYVASFLFLHHRTLNLIRFYDVQYKLLQLEKMKHEERRPWKFFKSTYHKWKIESDQLDIEVERVFCNLMAEYIRLAGLVMLF